MRKRILLFLLAWFFTGNVTATDSYELYLVRHAEKQPDGSHDPELTEAGKNRSEQLARWLHHKDIKEIWSSDYRRTRDTAIPLRSRLGLELNIYDPRDLDDLARKLQHTQRTALIVGHSNTTPELARLLCDCFIADMEESEYDRLIVISVTDKKTQAETLQQTQLFKTTLPQVPTEPRLGEDESR